MMKGTSDVDRDKEEKKWRAETDLRVLVEAEEIRKDEKRLAAAKKIGHEQARALRTVTANRSAS